MRGRVPARPFRGVRRPSRYFGHHFALNALHASARIVVSVTSSFRIRPLMRNITITAVFAALSFCVTVQAKTAEIDALRERAEQGDADSQYTLGFLYATGEVVAQDDAAALHWLRLAAEQGDSRGMKVDTAMTYTFDKLSVGLKHQIQTSISDKELDQYISLTKDSNPLHTDKSYAKAHGFSDRLVHGALLLGVMSRIVGVHLPGDNAILMSLSGTFKGPVIVNQAFTVSAEIVSLIEFAHAIKVKFILTSPGIESNVGTGDAMVKLRS